MTTTGEVVERPALRSAPIKKRPPIVTTAAERAPVVRTICALLALKGHHVEPLADPQRYLTRDSRGRVFAYMRKLAVRDPRAERPDRRGKLGGAWIGEGEDRRYVDGVRLGYATQIMRIILDNCQSDGICWRSYESIADEAERSRSWVFETLSIFERLGLVVRVSMNGRFGPLGIRQRGAPRSNGYYVPLARDDARPPAELAQGDERAGAPATVGDVLGGRDWAPPTFIPAARRVAPVILALELLRDLGRVDVPTDALFASKLLGFGASRHRDPARRGCTAWLVEAAILSLAKGAARKAAEAGAPLALAGKDGLESLLYRAITIADPVSTPPPGRARRIATAESAAAADSGPSVGPPKNFADVPAAAPGAPRHAARQTLEPRAPAPVRIELPPSDRPDIDLEVERLRAERAEQAAAAAELRALGRDLPGPAPPDD